MWYRWIQESQLCYLKTSRRKIRRLNQGYMSTSTFAGIGNLPCSLCFWYSLVPLLFCSLVPDPVKIFNFYFVPIASQSGYSKKMSTTSMVSSTSGTDYLSTTLERKRPSKEVSETPLGRYMLHAF